MSYPGIAMRTTVTKTLFFTLCVVANPLAAGSAAAGDVAEIAGLHPDRRPDEAPFVSTVQKDAGWYKQALQGVEPPYPGSLRFLEDQGNWYSPFLHPGMSGPYDFRGWHAGGAAGSP